MVFSILISRQLRAKLAFTHGSNVTLQYKLYTILNNAGINKTSLHYLRVGLIVFNVVDFMSVGDSLFDNMLISF